MKYVLRKIRAGDCSSFTKHANNPNVARGLRDAFPSPYTEENARVFFGQIKKNKRDITLAIDVNGEAVGCMGVTFKGDVYSKTCELGYWLGEEFWSKGIMTAAVGEMCGYVFSNYDIVRIATEVFDFNTASRRVLEKNGFVCEGILKKSIYKNGEIHDSLVMALCR